jgi:branched-subunit amino acid ABC-type transport system permease component
LVVPHERVFIMVVALGCLAGMGIFLYYSQVGRRIQACDAKPRHGFVSGYLDAQGGCAGV